MDFILVIYFLVIVSTLITPLTLSGRPRSRTMLENPQFYDGTPHKTEAERLFLSSLVSSSTPFNRESGYLKRQTRLQLHR